MFALGKPAIGAPCNNCGLCCRLHICRPGAFVLGLVTKLGARAEGPCPALINDDGLWLCGVMTRPKDYLTSHYGVKTLRRAFGLLIGVGAGCDEAGAEPIEIALAKLQAIQAAFLEAVDEAKMFWAMKVAFDLE